MDGLGINVARFLGYSYNHGDLISVINNKAPYQTLWKGKYETIDNHIPDDIQLLEVVKWGIEHNGIVIYVDYEGV